MEESLREYYLASMGITSWKAQEPLSQQELVGADAWSDLKSSVNACTQCALHQSRKNAVFGIGDPQADLMIIGEAPGANEDSEGEPFVGRAGKLLNAMLLAVGLTREQVFICNVLKCRPPQNRDPLPEELKQCSSFLEAQVAHIKPKLILVLGRVAAHSLLGLSTPLSSLRGQRYFFTADEVPLIVTYHPAYLLRSPREKKKTYQDLELACNMLK